MRIDALENDPGGEQDRTLALIALIGDAQGGGRSIMQLDSAEVAQLQVLAGEHGQAAGRARNILCFGYGICPPPRTGGDGGSEKMRAVPEEQEKKREDPTTQATLLRIFPNPTNGTVTFMHGSEAPLENASIMVRDAAGREVARLPVNGRDRIVWDARSVRPGAYLVELIAGTSRLAVQRLVVHP